MKVKSVTPLNDGMDRGFAEEFWTDVAGFAAYSFNKSHAVAYSLISYQAMYLKVKYPTEFWSGLLSMVNDDRRDAALTDMKRMGISLLPPDANQSEVHFAPMNDAVVLMPFAAIKGITIKSAAIIVETREEKGLFTSIEDFIAKVPGRACHKGQREKLDLVGGFSRIEPTQLPADHHSRRRDQMELLTGLMTEAVVIDREMEVSATSVVNLTGLINDWKACTRCELTGLCHPKPFIHGPVKAMLIVDGPNFFEEKADEMGNGGAADSIEASLATAGLKLEDVYITGMVKSPKPEKGRNYSTKTLAECGIWLNEEIRILQPPVVVILGANTFKRFFPALKGGMTEHVGKVVYDKTRDLNLLVGMNPAVIFFNPEKSVILDGVMQQLVGLLPV